MGLPLPRMAAAFMALLVLLHAASAIEPFSEYNYKTFISLSTEGSAVHAKIAYIDTNYLYIPKPSSAPEKVDDFFEPGDYSESSFSASVVDLGSAELAFTLDGQEITDASGNPSCVLVTDDRGWATCNVEYLKDASGSIKPFQSQKSCGLLQATYKGKYIGSMQLQPTSSSISLCPRDNLAISAFGTSLFSSLSANSLVCFPALLIVGLLIASMHYSGRDPLSLLDITTPRLPKMRQFRVRGPQLPQMIRSVMRQTYKTQDKSMKAMRLHFKGALNEKIREMQKGGAGKPDIRNFKREMEARFRAAWQAYLKELAAAGKGAMDSAKFNAILKEFNRIMAALRPSSANEAVQNAWQNRFKQVAPNLDVYDKARLLRNSIGAARGRSEGPIASRVSKGLDKITKGMTKIEASKIMSVPVVGFIPRRLTNALNKRIDIAAQWRASRMGGIALRREIVGKAVSMLMEKSRATRPAGRLFEKETASADGTRKKELTWLGKFTKWQSGGWTFSKWDEKRNIKTNDVRNTAKQSIMHSPLYVSHYFDSAWVQVRAALFNAKDLEKALKDDVKKLLKGIARAKTPEEKKALEARMAELGKMSTQAKVFAVANSSLIEGKLESGDTTALKKLQGQLQSIQGMAGETRALLGKWADYAQKMAGISSQLSAGSILLSDGLSQGYVLLESNGLSGRVGFEKKHIRLFTAYEKSLIKNFLLERRGTRYFAAEWAQVNEFEMKLRTVTLDPGKPRDPNLPPLTPSRISSMVEQEMAARFPGLPRGADGKLIRGADGNLSKNAFDAKREAGMQQFIDRWAANEAIKNKDPNARRPGFGDRMLALADDTNRKVYAQIEREFSSKKPVDFARIRELLLARAISLGEHPEGAHLDAVFRALGMLDRDGRAFRVRSLDDFESLSKRGPQEQVQHFQLQLQKAIAAGKLGDKMRDALAKAVGADAASAMADGNFGRALSKQQQAALEHVSNSALSLILNENKGYTRMWNAAMFASIMSVTPQKDWGMHGVSPKNYNPLNPAEAAFLAKSQEAVDGWVKEYALKEWADLRSRHGTGMYSADVEEALATARGFGKMNGWVAWTARGRGSWGEDMLGLMRQNLAAEGQITGYLKNMYLSLVNERARDNDGNEYGSKYYDREFADKVRSEGLSSGKFGAKEYEALMARGITLRDYKLDLPFAHVGDGRGAIPLFDRVIAAGKPYNFAPMLAQTAIAPFATQMNSLVALIKVGDKWVYANPGKGGIMSEIMGAANYTGIRGEVSKAAAGYDAKSGAYGNAPVLVVTARDLQKYMPGNKDNFFGSLSKSDKAVAWVRSRAWGGADVLNQVLQGGLVERGRKMYDWHAASIQMQSALDVLQKQYDRSMTPGKDRFRVSDEGLDRVNQSLSSESRGILQSKMGKESLETLLRKEAEKMATGSTWYNLKRTVGSKAYEDAASAESAWYTAKLELKALDSMKGKIDKGDFNALHAELEKTVKSLKGEYKGLAKETRDLRDSAIVFSGSHGSAYDTNYGLFTKVFPLTWILDSKQVNSEFDDYFNRTQQSAMRDPRSAIGYFWGFSHAYQMGYQTGQTIYEPGRLWTTMPWEKQYAPYIAVTRFAHRIIMKMMNPIGRQNYPEYFSQDYMLPTQGRAKNTFGELFEVLSAPFSYKRSSDFMHRTINNMANFTGAAAVIAAYQKTGSDKPSERGNFRQALDHFFKSTSWEDNAAQYYKLQRPLEVYKYKDAQFQKMLGREGSMLDIYAQYRVEKDEEKKEELRKQMEDESGKYFQGVSGEPDQRPWIVQKSHSGGPMEDRGGKNRFVLMYVANMSNIWNPVFPGELDASPTTGEVYGTSEMASQTLRSKSEAVRSMGGMYVGEYDVKNDLMRYNDAFSTEYDAMRSIYKENNTALLHLLHNQQDKMAYSFMNSPMLPMLLAAPMALSGAGLFGVAGLIPSAVYSKALMNIRAQYFSRTSFGGSIADRPLDDWGADTTDYYARLRDMTGFSAGNFQSGIRPSLTQGMARKIDDVKETYRSVLAVKRMTEEEDAALLSANEKQIRKRRRMNKEGDATEKD